MTGAQDGPPAPGRVWLVATAVAVLTFVVFLPALDNGFVNWDDDHNFTNNESYRGLGAEHLRWMFTTFHRGHFHPFTWLSFGIDHALWGMEPWGYHLTNVLLHAATAVALFFLARALFHGTSLVAPFAAAALFAVHPLRVESVAWVTERRDCLSGLFLVAALLAYLRYARAGAPRERRAFYGLTLACVAASLLSKAWGMTLPAVMLLLDVYPLRRRVTRAVLLEKLPFLALSAGAALLAIRAQDSAGALQDVGAHGIGARIAQASYGLVYYVTKTLWPSGLTPIHDRPADMSLLDATHLAALALAVAVTLVAFAARRRFPVGLAAWVAYVVVVSPVLGIAQSGVQLVADRYSYLACMSFALLAGLGIERLWTRGRSEAAALLVVVLAALSTVTWRLIGVWRDSESLWAHVLEVDPESATGNQYRATLLVDAGDRERAVEHFRRSLAARPHPHVHGNLGITLVNMERYAEAEEHLLQAVDEEDSVPALRALAFVQARLGRRELPATLRRLEAAAPDDPQIRAFVRQLRGRREQAE